MTTKLADPYNKYKLEKKNVCLFTRIRGRRVTWEVSHTCNMRCLHCCQGDLKRNAKNAALPEKRYAEIVEKLKMLDTTAVYISGGEPFLVPHFGRILSLLKSKNIYTSVATNGMVLDKRKISMLTKNNVDKILISLDHHKPEYHDGMRGKNGAWSLVTQRIKNAAEAGLYVRIGTTIWKQMCSFEDLSKFVEMGIELGAGEIAFNWIMRVGNARKNSDIFPERSWFDITGDLDSIRRMYGTDILITYKPFEKLEGDVEGCRGGSNFFHIAYNGKVTPCSWIGKCDMGGIHQPFFVWDVGSDKELTALFEPFRGYISDNEKRLGPFCPVVNYTFSGDYLHTDPRR